MVGKNRLYLFISFCSAHHGLRIPSAWHRGTCNVRHLTRSCFISHSYNDANLCFQWVKCAVCSPKTLRSRVGGKGVVSLHTVLIGPLDDWFFFLSFFFGSFSPIRSRRLHFCCPFIEMPLFMRPVDNGPNDICLLCPSIFFLLPFHCLR